MIGFTLVSYKLIRVDCNQFDKHFCSFHYVFVFKNKPKWSFLHCTQVLKIECAMECPPSSGKFVSYKQTGKVKNCHQWRKVARFSFYICQYIKKMIMWHDLLLFLKKMIKHNWWILLEFSIKTNEFVWLLM